MGSMCNFLLNFVTVFRLLELVGRVGKLPKSLDILFLIYYIKCQSGGNEDWDLF